MTARQDACYVSIYGHACGRQAGMTTGGRIGLSLSRLPLCHSWKIPDFSPLRHLWTGSPVCGERARLQDVGGRAASGTSRRGGRAAPGTKAEESSGVYNPFPHSGNDNRRDNRTRYPAKPAIPSPSRPAFLDSGLRRNDNGGRNGFVAIPTALCHSRKKSQPLMSSGRAGIVWPGSSPRLPPGRLK